VEIVIIWLLLCVVVAVAAGSRGRNGLGWFLLAFILSPLIAGFLIIVLPSRRIPVMAGQARRESEQGLIEWATTKKTDTRLRACPFCAEAIQPQAIVCRHCGRDLPAAPKPAPRWPWNMDVK
jgi:hypothetical protein